MKKLFIIRISYRLLTKSYWSMDEIFRVNASTARGAVNAAMRDLKLPPRARIGQYSIAVENLGKITSLPDED